MRKIFSVFGNFSSEDSTNKKIKTRTKKEAEEGPAEQPEVNGQSKKAIQYDEKKGKSKKKPQVTDSLREEDRDTKVKKKKNRDRDSGLGEMVNNDNSPPSDPTRRRRMQQASKYGYFESELEGEGMRSRIRHYSVQGDNDDDDGGDDDDLPLGIRKNRSTSSLGFCHRGHTSQEYVEEKNRLSLYRHSTSVFPNGDLSPGSTRPPKPKVIHPPEPLNMNVTSSSRPAPSPVATTPPLVSNNRQASRESRQYFRERKFSSSNSSESSASCDSGVKTRSNDNALCRAGQQPSPSTQYPPGKSQCYNGWNGGLDYEEENYNDHESRNPYHLNIPITPITSRVRNLSLNLAVPRSDSFTRGIPPPRRASDGAILSGKIPCSEKDKKSMKMAEYHKYQEEKIAAQYHRYRVNPLPVADQEVTPPPVRPMTPTLMQIQQEYKSVNARRFVDLNDGSSSPGRPKRISLADTSRRISMTESNSGRTRSSIVGKSPTGKPEHRKNNSEITIMQQQLNVPRAPQPQKHASSALQSSPQYTNSATSLSSSGSTSGSGGPPTPNSRHSIMFGNSNITGSKLGTPSSMVKDKRRKSGLNTAMI